MPIYVYRCESCGAVEEHIQRFGDPPQQVCETCGGRLHKQITSAAFHLKGGGWYKDGYASSKPDAGGSGEASGDSSDSSGSDRGSDAPSSSASTDSKPDKPAAKADSSPKADKKDKKKKKDKKAGTG